MSRSLNLRSLTSFSFLEHAVSTSEIFWGLSDGDTVSVLMDS